MGLVNEIGQAFGFASNKVWHLKSIDNPSDDAKNFAAQFTAEGLQHDLGARVGQEDTLGSEQPGIHYVNDQAETIRFRAKIYRTSPVQSDVADALSNPISAIFGGGPQGSSASVKSQIEKLKSFCRKDENLGRLERFMFTWGVELKYEILVLTVGGVKYDDIRSDGTIRGASFDLVLQIVKAVSNAEDGGISLAAGIKTAFGVITTSAGALSSVGGFGGIGNGIQDGLSVFIPGGSPHRVVKRVQAKSADTFESIARDQWGNAMLGEVLRRSQPEKLDLKEGDIVKMIRREEAFQISLTPQSVALRDRAENRALLEGFLGLRGKKAIVA